MPFTGYPKIVVNAGLLVMFVFSRAPSIGSSRDSAFSQVIQNPLKNWACLQRYDLMQLLTGFDISLDFFNKTTSDELARGKLIEDLRSSFLVIDSLCMTRKQEKSLANVKVTICEDRRLLVYLIVMG